MLDAWVIEKVREQEKQVEERPQIRCPVPEDYPQEVKEKDKPKEERGVYHINIGGNDDED